MLDFKRIIGKELPDIEYSKNASNMLIDSPNSMYQIPFYKDDDYFSNLESYTTFVKGCEKKVRENDRYSKYKKYLQSEIKLDHCQVFKLLGTEDCDIEMHHGPIFTLFDICAIVLQYFLKKGWKVSTFRIAQAVLQEHLENRVQVVMLSSSAHEQVHARNIFIHYSQAYGDLTSFIRKYWDVMPDYLKDKYDRYLDRCRMMDSDDFGLFDLNDKLWKP